MLVADPKVFRLFLKSGSCYQDQERDLGFKEPLCYAGNFRVGARMRRDRGLAAKQPKLIVINTRGVGEVAFQVLGNERKSRDVIRAASSVSLPDYGKSANALRHST
nr:hypothetical protein Iba_chr05fCG5530 [Ipomoea batatas]